MTTSTVRLYHGDYRTMLAAIQADLIVTSPPYNIGSKQPRRDGRRRHGLYDAKSYGAIRDYPDAVPEEVYQQEQVDFFLWCADHLTRDGILVYNHKPRRRHGCMLHPGQWFLRPAVQAQLQLMEEIIWDRGSTHNHCPRMMWPQTERLYVFRRAGGQYHLRNDKTTQLAFQSDVWRITRSRANGHNAPFPLTLAEAIVRAWSEPGAEVCDPYAGSGTTGEAALKCNRSFVGAEVLSTYYDLACTRLARFAKEAA